MKLDLEVVQRLHDEWAARQAPDAPTFGGPNGNLYFADDADFWTMVERMLVGGGNAQPK